MTRVKIYFHRHHCECANLPVPVKTPPIVHISLPHAASVFQKNENPLLTSQSEYGKLRRKRKIERKESLS